MMGQQQTAVAEKESGALRRMVLVLTVAALMAALMVLPASPALAKNCIWTGDTHVCHQSTESSSGNAQGHVHENDRGGEPAGGGGTEVSDSPGQHKVITPSGTYNYSGHSKK